MSAQPQQRKELNPQADISQAAIDAVRYRAAEVLAVAERWQKLAEAELVRADSLLKLFFLSLRVGVSSPRFHFFIACCLGARRYHLDNATAAAGMAALMREDASEDDLFQAIGVKASNEPKNVRLRYGQRKAANSQTAEDTYNYIGHFDHCNGHTCMFCLERMSRKHRAVALEIVRAVEPIKSFPVLGADGSSVEQIIDERWRFITLTLPDYPSQLFPGLETANRAFRLLTKTSFWRHRVRAGVKGVETVFPESERGRLSPHSHIHCLVLSSYMDSGQLAKEWTRAVERALAARRIKVVWGVDKGVVSAHRVWGENEIGAYVSDVVDRKKLLRRCRKGWLIVASAGKHAFVNIKLVKPQGGSVDADRDIGLEAAVVETCKYVSKPASIKNLSDDDLLDILKVEMYGGRWPRCFERLGAARFYETIAGPYLPVRFVDPRSGALATDEAGDSPPNIAAVARIIPMTQLACVARLARCCAGLGGREFQVESYKQAMGCLRKEAFEQVIEHLRATCGDEDVNAVYNRLVKEFKADPANEGCAVNPIAIRDYYASAQGLPQMNADSTASAVLTEAECMGRAIAGGYSYIKEKTQLDTPLLSGLERTLRDLRKILFVQQQERVRKNKALRGVDGSKADLIRRQKVGEWVDRMRKKRYRTSNFRKRQLVAKHPEAIFTTMSGEAWGWCGQLTVSGADGSGAALHVA